MVGDSQASSRRGCGGDLTRVEAEAAGTGRMVERSGVPWWGASVSRVLAEAEESARYMARRGQADLDVGSRVREFG